MASAIRANYDRKKGAEKRDGKKRREKAADLG